MLKASYSVQIDTSPHTKGDTDEERSSGVSEYCALYTRWSRQKTKRDPLSELRETRSVERLKSLDSCYGLTRWFFAFSPVTKWSPRKATSASSSSSGVQTPRLARDPLQLAQHRVEQHAETARALGVGLHAGAVPSHTLNSFVHFLRDAPVTYFRELL